MAPHGASSMCAMLGCLDVQGRTDRRIGRSRCRCRLAAVSASRRRSDCTFRPRRSLPQPASAMGAGRSTASGDERPSSCDAADGERRVALPVKKGGLKIRARPNRRMRVLDMARLANCGRRRQRVRVASIGGVSLLSDSGSELLDVYRLSMSQGLKTGISGERISMGHT